MRAVRWVPALAVVVVLVLIAGFAATRLLGFLTSGSTSGYKLRIAMADANQMYVGMPTWIHGLPAGKVTSVSTQGDAAMVTVALKSGNVPLHAGTRGSVTWQSVLGQKYVTLLPGPRSSPPLASGSLIASNDQVTVQDLLDALNAPTRRAVSGIVNQLDGATRGQGQNLNATLHTAAPTAQAVNQILDAVSQDGPDLRQIVAKLHQVTAALAPRQDQLSSTVSGLGQVTSAAASQQGQLTSALSQLPSVLGVAKSTLDVVPPATGAVDPLLGNLLPAIDQLPQTAANLSPVLSALAPTLPELDSTLQAANVLLTRTPGLLDGTNAVLPGLTQAAGTLQPALAFLRPYTPEIVGAVGTFGNGFAGYDSNGHYAAADVYLGAGQVGALPTGLFNLIPGAVNRTAPLPGANVNQPWTDAFGSPAR